MITKNDVSKLSPLLDGMCKGLTGNALTYLFIKRKCIVKVHKKHMMTQVVLAFLGIASVLTSEASVSSSSSLCASSSVAIRNKDCIVVGGGPVGLAAALTLSNPPHCMNVTVLEKSEGGDTYDPSRSFIYGITRGMQWFRHNEKDHVLVNNASDKLRAVSTVRENKNNFAQIIIVPGDPNVPIEKPKEFRRSRSSFLVLRHQLIGVLKECCLEQEQKRQQNGNDSSMVGSIRLLSSKCVDSIHSNTSDTNNSLGDILTVHCTDGSQYSAALIISADGINSIIRNRLGQPVDGRESWLHSKSRSFRLKSYTAPSTGKKLKALHIPVNFQLKNTDGSIVEGIFTNYYQFNSIHIGPTNKLSFVPMAFQVNMKRPAYLTAWSNHEIFSLKTGRDCKEWFSKAFPRLPLDEWIDNEEWDHFASATSVVTFPQAQYLPQTAISSPDGLAGVAFVGDSCHSFPPDIGQGVNAGLQDVVALDRSLRGLDPESGKNIKSEPVTLGHALLAYERNRLHEHHALIRIARFAYPRQTKIGMISWNCNNMFRSLLNKISFGTIPLPCQQLLVLKPDKTYRQIMQSVDITVFILRSICVLSILWFLVHKH